MLLLFRSYLVLFRMLIFKLDTLAMIGSIHYSFRYLLELEG